MVNFSHLVAIPEFLLKLIQFYLKKKTFDSKWKREITILHFYLLNIRTTDSQHEAVSTKTSENVWFLKNT